MAAGDIRVADPLNAVHHEMDRVARGHHVKKRHRSTGTISYTE